MIYWNSCGPAKNDNSATVELVRCSPPQPWSDDWLSPN
jgi:hypothetical protein